MRDMIEELIDEFKKMCEHRFFRFKNSETVFLVTYASIQKDVNIEGRLLYRIESIYPSYYTDELEDTGDDNKGGIVFNNDSDVFSSIEEFKKRYVEVSAEDFYKSVVRETKYYLNDKFETYNGQKTITNSYY